jgi:hypothetical protein
MGSSREYKNPHQAPFPPSPSAKGQQSQATVKRTDLYSLKYILQQKVGSSRALTTSNPWLRQQQRSPKTFTPSNFQLKAFTIAIGFVFGKDSILATKLWDFVVNVNRKHSIIYKNRIAIDNKFSAKVLWSVDCFTQLFLEDCHKCHDQEDLNQRVINFNGLNMDLILHRFHAILPPLFHKLNDKSDENNNSKFRARNGGKGKRKGGSNGNEEEQRNSQKKNV